MKRIFMICIAVIMMVGCCLAQKPMTPPHVMVVPDLIYCKSHGFTQQFNNNGIIETVPDYERALTEDHTLHAVLTQIAQLIMEADAQSKIVIVDLIEAINNAKADLAMATANSGDELESVDEAIIRNSEADILVKVQFDFVKNGPEYRVSYVLNGTDAYTSRNFAPVSGLGKGSTSANPVALIREAVHENMETFTASLHKYYENMLENGRMVALEIKTTSTSSVDMNSKVGQYTLRELIDDFVYDNTVDGNGTERMQSGSTFMRYQGIYIPLQTTIRGRQRKQGAKDIAQKLVNFLEEYGVSADYKVRGLGKVNIYLR